jgi:hypothetical protein
VGKNRIRGVPYSLYGAWDTLFACRVPSLFMVHVTLLKLKFKKDLYFKLFTEPMIRFHH